MSTVYTKTDNYGLNLYGDNDPADLRDGYNNSMRTIDTTLETHLNRIEGVETRETHDEAVMKALLVDNTVDNATAAKNRWDTVDSKISAVSHDETIKGDGTPTAPLGIDDNTVAKIVSLDNATSGNVVLHGIDNTGTKNVSDAINNLAKTVKNLYFPAGIYLLDKPIDLSNVNITCENNAQFKAVAPMDVMVNFTTTDIDKRNTHYNFSGGTFNGAAKVSTVLKFAGNNICQISNIIIENGVNCNLDVTDYHGIQVQNLYIDGHEIATSVGIKTSFDDQYTNIRVLRCATGIQTKGYNNFTNTYIWSGTASMANKTKTIGFDILHVEEIGNSYLQFSDLYLDCTQIGFKLNSVNDIIWGCNLFWYQDSNQVPNNLESYVVFAPKDDFIFQVNNIKMLQTRESYFSNKIPESTFSMTSKDQSKCSDFWHSTSSRNLRNITAFFTCKSDIVLNSGEAIPLFRVTGSYGDLFTITSTTSEFVRLRVDRYDIHEIFHDAITQGTFYIDKETTIDEHLNMPYKTVWYANKTASAFKHKKFMLRFEAASESIPMTGYGQVNGLPDSNPVPFADIEANVVQFSTRQA